MSPEEESKIVALMRAARAKRRGYADFFSWPIDRDLEEWGIANSLKESLEATGNDFFADLRRRGRGNDPPDLEAVNLQRQRIAIEITELVDESAIKKYKQTNDYDWAEWDKNKFINSLQYAINAKDKKFVKLKGSPYPGGYFLVIHTDEPELKVGLVDQYLHDSNMVSPKHLKKVYLLISYDPDVGHCPVREIKFSDKHN